VAVAQNWLNSGGAVHDGTKIHPGGNSP